MSSAETTPKQTVWTAAARRGGELLRKLASIGFVQRVGTFIFPQDEAKYTDPEFDFLSPDRLIRTGTLVVVVFVLGFLGWAALAPLNSAISAPGVVVVESRRKAIQHLEGGIVRDILVSEGMNVQAGQALIQLDDTEAGASVELVRGASDALAAQEARLEAERDNASAITFPADLLARKSDPKVAAAIRGEENAFNANRATLSKQIAIYNQRVKENQRVAAGMDSEQQGIDQQRKLIAQETTSVQQLYANQLATLPRLLQLQRQAADLDGQHGKTAERIAQVSLDSGEDQLQILNLRNQYMAEVVKDLREVQTKRFEAMDRLHASKDIYSRLRVTTPVAGKVVGLTVHSKGAVIRPGETIMEIVPDADQLVVEAHVKPEDADAVHIGMTAKVGLGANKQRRLPMITGTVTAMSADRLVDPRTGLGYFNAEVAIDRKQLAGYQNIRLIPGMPVDVALDTGSRTALEYFLEPISSVFRLGMRER